jgi:hypothetical protein
MFYTCKAGVEYRDNELKLCTMFGLWKKGERGTAVCFFLLLTIESEYMYIELKFEMHTHIFCHQKNLNAM